MKIGFAFRGRAGTFAAVPEILKLCRKIGLSAEGYVLTGDTLSGFLSTYSGIPAGRKRKFYRQLKRRKFSLETIPVPMVYCEYDLLNRRAVYHGPSICFPKEEEKENRTLLQIDRNLSQRGVYRLRHTVYYNGYLSAQHLFLGLTLLRCQYGILFELVSPQEPGEVVRLTPKQKICKIPLDPSQKIPEQIRCFFQQHQLELIAQ